MDSDKARKTVHGWQLDVVPQDSNGGVPFISVDQLHHEFAEYTVQSIMACEWAFVLVKLLFQVGESSSHLLMLYAPALAPQKSIGE